MNSQSLNSRNTQQKQVKQVPCGNPTESQTSPDNADTLNMNKPTIPLEQDKNIKSISEEQDKISEDDWKVVEARLQQDIDNGKGDEIGLMWIGNSQSHGYKSKDISPIEKPKSIGSSNTGSGKLGEKNEG